MRVSHLKAQSIACKIQAIGLSLFFICQVASAQSAVLYSSVVDSVPRQVGDIPYDPLIDDPAFTVCDAQRVFQYYNTRSYFKDHKREIVNYFVNNYRAGLDTTANQTGYLTIRFIINCAGETGRFRLYQLDSAYQTFRFNGAVPDQLLKLTRQWKGWQPAKYKNKVYDSYQYITFTLKRGRIVCITP
jgi:hypothetical protein